MVYMILAIAVSGALGCAIGAGALAAFGAAETTLEYSLDSTLRFALAGAATVSAAALMARDLLKDGWN